jgi:hypothetical protein
MGVSTAHHEFAARPGSTTSRAASRFGGSARPGNAPAAQYSAPAGPEVPAQAGPVTPTLRPVGHRSPGAGVMLTVFEHEQVAQSHRMEDPFCGPTRGPYTNMTWELSQAVVRTQKRANCGEANEICSAEIKDDGAGSTRDPIDQLVQLAIDPDVDIPAQCDDRDIVFEPEADHGRTHR